MIRDAGKAAAKTLEVAAGVTKAVADRPRDSAVLKRVAEKIRERGRGR